MRVLLALLLLAGLPARMFCSSFKVAIVIEDALISADTVHLAVTRAANHNYRIFPIGSGRSIDYRLINATRCQSVTAVRQVCQEAGLSGIIGVGGCALMQSLQRLGKTLTLPTIVIPSDLCSLASESAFDFIGTGDSLQLLRAAAEALRFHRAPTAAIFYDRFQSLAQLEAFQNDLSASGISVMAFQLDEGKNLSDILSLLIKGQVRFSVIFATPENVMSTLEIARNASLMEQNYHWLLLDSGLSLASLKSMPSISSSANLLVVRHPTYGLLDMHGYCRSDVQKIFPACDKNHVTSLEYRFVDAVTALGKAFNDFANSTADSYSVSNATCRPLQPWIGGASVAGFVSSLRDLNTFRSVISYNTSSNRLEAPYVEFAATFNELADQPVDFVESARFYPGNGSLRVLRTVSGRSLVFANAFVDFKNRTLTVCAPSVPPFTAYTNVNADMSGNVTGQIRDLFVFLMRNLNFRSIFKQAPDLEFGGPIPNSTLFTGCVGELQKGNAHLSLVYAITTHRISAVDFSVPVASSGLTILAKRPPPQSRMWNIFAPFTIDLWILLGVALFAVAFVTFVLAYYSPFTAYNLQLEYAIADEIWLHEYIWSAVGSFLQQGQDFYPFAMSPRTVMAFWWLFTVIVFGSYTGNLTAYLTVSVTPLKIRGLNDLIANPQYKVLVAKGTNIHALIRLSTSGPYFQLQRQMVEVDSMPICAETVLKDSDPNKVCITDQNVNSHYYNNYCSQVYVADEVFSPYFLSFAYPKDAFYGRAFDFILEKAQESGIAKLLNLKYFPLSNPECAASSVSAEADPINMDGVTGAYIVSGCLYACGLLLLLLELLWTRVLKKSPLDAVIF